MAFGFLVSVLCINCVQPVTIGGSHQDWQEATYAKQVSWQCTTPMYMGGLIKELVFQEVISNSESAEGQPLGTLAGKGTLSGKHKGGKIVIHLLFEYVFSIFLPMRYNACMCICMPKTIVQEIN